MCVWWWSPTRAMRRLFGLESIYKHRETVFFPFNFFFFFAFRQVAPQYARGGAHALDRMRSQGWISSVPAFLGFFQREKKFLMKYSRLLRRKEETERDDALRRELMRRLV